MSAERHISVWNNCLMTFANLVSEQEFKTWFQKIRPVSLVDATLTIEVPTDFFREYLESAYLDIIRKTLRKEIGADARLIYTYSVVSNQPQVKISGTPMLRPENRPIQIMNPQGNGCSNYMVYPGTARYKIDPRLNTTYSFSNLIKGSCNKLGVSAGETICFSPGKNPYNPLFIFGGSGLGKTHLAQAIGLEVKERHPELVVLYISGNDFKTQYMDAIKKNSLTDFLAFYKRIDLLIIDDIQDLAGKASQYAFFNVFNFLHQNGKQIILTSDRAPVDLDNFENRLVSRFKWGLSVELTQPDYETRLEMLKARSLREGVIISDEVLEYLASRIKSNFRELEGALISLMASSTLAHEDLSIDLAKRITECLVTEDHNELSIGRVQRVVCEYFNISSEDMLSKTRKRQIVQARQIAMYLSRTLISNCSLAAIGSEIGGKDHATVLHACSTVSDLMATDKLFRKYVTDIQSLLSPSVQ